MNCLRRHLCWQSMRFYWERAPRWRAIGWETPGEQLCHVAHSLGFYGAGIVQPRWMLVRGILGSGRTRGVSFRPFLNSSGWWWLISSVFLIRISCHKITHAHGYYGAWPGWAVSISVFPLTALKRDKCHLQRWALVGVHSTLYLSSVPWVDVLFNWFFLVFQKAEQCGVCNI